MISPVAARILDRDSTSFQFIPATTPQHANALALASTAAVIVFPG
jgi:hypothetical protein